MTELKEICDYCGKIVEDAYKKFFNEKIKPEIPSAKLLGVVKFKTNVGVIGLIEVPSGITEDDFCKIKEIFRTDVNVEKNSIHKDYKKRIITLQRTKYEINRLIDIDFKQSVLDKFKGQDQTLEAK